jgi:hypothetical protein
MAIGFSDARRVTCIHPIPAQICMSCNRINSRRRERRNDRLSSYEANTMFLCRLSHDLFDHGP